MAIGTSSEIHAWPPWSRHTATHSVTEPGLFRRAFAAFWAVLEALEAGGSGYTFDRIERLEREVGGLKEELRQSRDQRTADDSAAGASVVARIDRTPPEPT